MKLKPIFFKKKNFPLSYYLIVYYYEKSVNKDIFICEIFIITGRVNYIVYYTHAPLKRFLYNALKMSYKKLLSGLSEDRQLFIWKVYHEMENNTIANMPDRENQKAYFLRLIEWNEELSEIEKRYCRECFIYDDELENARDKLGGPRECDKCQTTRYSDRFCEQYISLHLQSLFNTWTSENEIIDDFIHQCQILSSLPSHILEWIPFEEFKKVEKLTGGGFSSIYTATWTGELLLIMMKMKRNLFVLDLSVLY